MKSIILLLSIVLVQLSSFSQVLKSSYAIQNVKTGQNLRPYEAMKSNGNKIVMYNHKAWQCMTWDFKNVSGAIYTLQNQYTSKSFQPSDISAKVGSTLVQQALNGLENQQWEFIPVENNYLIRLKGTELYITATENDENKPVSLQLLQKNNLLQTFRLIEQHPNG